ncbi:MAG: TlpA disulfide reductase family protein [Bryobacteraceae bacterium]|jgi:peroxiredoxin
MTLWDRRFHLSVLALATLFCSRHEQPIAEAIRHLRDVPDAQRGAVTRNLALEIRQLPASKNKLILANDLANLSTEGDFGRDTLQEVATTLADALREQTAGAPEDPWVELAQLAHYEHVPVSMDSPRFTAAIARIESDDRRRAQAEFTLTDLEGRVWTLHNLRDRVVLVNFWATWCPPCRKEMPDLNALYQQFGPQGLLILAISDEEAAKVQPFIEERKIAYPILLDPGDRAHAAFAVEGIPKSFLYDREGKLIAQAIDMRTRGQFLAMLGQAGLK